MRKDFFIPVSEDIGKLTNIEAFYYCAISLCNMFLKYVSIKQINTVAKIIDNKRIEKRIVDNLVMMGLVSRKTVKKRTPFFYGEKSVQIYKEAVRKNKSIKELQKNIIWTETSYYCVSSKLKTHIYYVPAGIMFLDISRSEKGILAKIYANSIRVNRHGHNVAVNNYTFLTKVVEKSSAIKNLATKWENMGLIRREKQKLYINHIFPNLALIELVEDSLTKI